MRWIIAAAVCTTLGVAPTGSLRAQDLQDTLGRLLQGFGGQGQGQQADPRYDQRQDPRLEGRGGDRRGAAYSERWDAQDRARALDEADRRLDAEQRRIDEDRRRIEAERRRLSR
jgi:hypothetical protein